ncbi:MAG: preprotein translocase subunit SecA [Acidobacteria bacterium ADurb.Bin051]|jgi:preprotein translocase subunit SecA|nr:MAG: preprotein translocase subunit SecA [Acidobacteria bacterium ADurb.Bin051]
MFDRLLTRIIGTKHERDVKRLQPLVAAINELEPSVRALDDDALRRRTGELRERLAQGAPLDDLLVPAFATVREAGRRTLDMRHFDVQLVGGIVLHQGKIAEMRTGEGKTLVATLPVYLNALAGKGVHVVTVNDYLARRDSEWMGQIYRFLGMSVGVIQHDLSDAERQHSYRCDITYATNNEIGFDYLRDNMKFDLDSRVQRGHHFAIVDEVDSILIDEARTPLIISGPSEESVDKYYRIDRIIPRLTKGEEKQERDGSKYTTGDFVVDEKAHAVALTEEGVVRVEKLLGIDNLYDIENMDLLHGVQQGLRAHHLYQRDVDYLLKDGQVVIVDEFTGRMMPGRRWSDGLHQAVEAKEGVRIERENQTLATVTFQNFFRMYEKLGGMTGTAATEATEFEHIYKLDVVSIPTNKPMIRDDRQDVIFRTAGEKWEAVVEEIEECAGRGQPALVGTLSIEKSEELSAMLKRKGIRHVVLNAKYHEKEASIVAQAGRKGAVTIATNMAGRGTDILLGGNPEGLARAEADPVAEPEAYAEALARYREICARERVEVLAAGGLHIVGTERHESRRIDNQLRGRSGRQGDPGSSRFFLSLEDDLMRIFGSDRIQGLMGRLGMQKGEAIEHRMVTRAIERAQKQVEGRNFETRKHLLEYDDVMNKQREAIYQLRSDILEGREGHDYVLGLARDILDERIDTHCPEKTDPRDWTLSELAKEILAFFDLNLYGLGLDFEKLGIEELRSRLWEAIAAKYREKEERLGSELMQVLERDVMLRFVDLAWKDHLLALDHLKEGIGLRGYGQRDPLNEYKRESYELFSELKERVEDTVVKTLFRLEPVSEQKMADQRSRREAPAPRLVFSAPSLAAPAAGQPGAGGARLPKVGRNDPCPCGSGKKYKKCHGATGSAG